MFEIFSPDGDLAETADKRYTLASAISYVERHAEQRRGWTGSWVIREDQKLSYLLKNSRGKLMKSVVVFAV